MAKFVLSRKKALEQYNRIKNIGKVSYSSKTNSEVGKILEKETDCLFSIHLVNELENIVDKSRVLFLAQAWDFEMIKRLVGMGVMWFVVDNENDLNVLINFLERKDIKVNLLLRVKLKENTIRTERYFVFGMSSQIVNERLRELRDNKNIGKLGIHFHRKTQNVSEWDIKYEMEEIIDREIVDIVNIGGGIPSVYANTNENVVELVIKKIKEFKEWFGKELIIEPGRFISAPAVKLVTKIINIYENNIVVDASVYNSDMDALVVPVKLLVENELEKGNAYVIKGITPCSMDLFRYRVYLENPKIGDKLVFLNAGAYNFGTGFCNLDKIETEVVE